LARRVTVASLILFVAPSIWAPAGAFAMVPTLSDHWEELMPAVLRVVLLAGVILTCVGVLGSEAFAADPVTKDDAVALVKKAIADIKDRGTEKAYAEIDNKSGKFVVGDFYIAVVGVDGTLLAYGADMHRVGDNVMNLKDPDGKEVVKERIELAQKQDSFGSPINS
jgi:hypothetical protein